MKIVRFHKDEANLVEWGDQSYFVYRNREGACSLIRARCPHRGGPLFLGSVLSEPVESIRCPWHDSVIPISFIQKKAPPMVVNGGECCVIIGAGAGEVNIRLIGTLINVHRDEVDCDAACV